MSELLKTEIEKYEKDWHVKITSVVTDNASNMAGMRNNINNSSMLLHAFGCQAHLLNLLCKHITAKLQSPVQRITSIIKHLRSHHAESSLLREKNTPRSPMPCDVRWNSMIDMLEYFCTHWSTIVVIINETMKSSDRIYRDMEDIGLKRVASELLEILKPIAIALNKLQRDTAVLGDGCEIRDNLCTASPSQFQEVVSKRSNQALSDVVLATNLLDSRYYGEKLNPVETKHAIDYVKTAKPDCLPSLMKYVAKEPPYSLLGEEFLASTPTSWWAAGTKLGFCPILAEIALSIVSAVPASAGLERHFSTLGLT